MAYDSNTIDPNEILCINLFIEFITFALDYEIDYKIANLESYISFKNNLYDISKMNEMNKTL